MHLIVYAVQKFMNGDKTAQLKQELVHTDVAKPIRIARAITTTEIKDIILFDVRSVVGGIDRVIQ